MPEQEAGDVSQSEWDDGFAHRVACYADAKLAGVKNKFSCRFHLQSCNGNRYTGDAKYQLKLAHELTSSDVRPLTRLDKYLHSFLTIFHSFVNIISLFSSSSTIGVGNSIYTGM